MKIPSVLAAAVLGALISSSGSAQSGNAPAARLPGNVVDVSAGEFFLRSPDTVRSGLTTFRLNQVGDVLTNPEKVEAENLLPATPDHDPTRAFHMLWVVRLEGNHSVSDWYNAHLKGEPAPWAIDMGGPSLATPPGSSNVTMQLDPGNYVLVCHVGSARADKNRHHVLKGMFRPLTVLPAKTASAAIPDANVIARITGTGQIQLSGEVRRGRQTIRIVNEAAKSYEFIVAQVNPGRTATEAVSWQRTDGTTHPTRPRGGLSDIPPGATRTTTIDFESGTYVFWTVRGPERSVAVTIPAA